MREVDRVRVVGRQAPVVLMEVFDADPPAVREPKRASLDAWRRAVDCYHGRDFSTAASPFGEVRAALPDDSVARLRHERSVAYCNAPPPDDWDGVTNLEQK